MSFSFGSDDAPPESVGPPRQFVDNNPGKGVEFIQHAFGATTLVAIFPDSGRIIAFWLDAETLPQAAAWAAARNAAGANIYYTLNRPKSGLSRKPKKTDIEAICGVGADIDAKDGRTLEQALAAISAVSLPPSLIVMSGGGYQPLWIFDTPIPATPDAVRRVEAVGRRVAGLTGGDAVQNIDRILRVPFTVNYPNAKKRAEGRVPCLSGILAPGAGQ